MLKRRKNFEAAAGPVILCIICFLSGKVQLPFKLDIDKVIKETFSVAAVNTKYQRPTLLEELDKALINEPEKPTKEVNSQPMVAIAEKINVTEKTVTYDKDQPDFTGYDNVFLTNHTDFNIDINSLMNNYNPPSKKEDVQILVIHTHATEGYADSIGSRTTETDKNMIKIGDVFTKTLKEKGFNVVHDVKLHDYPSYNGSYANSLKVMNWYMDYYPQIDIIFDLHRDAVGTTDDSRVKFVTEIDSKKAAQMMFVIGTNEGGLNHPSWQENLKFATGLQNVVCNMYPNLMRAVDLRKERFNQHVTKNSIIVEVGSNGNTIEEAEYAVTLLAEALSKYIT